MSVEENKATIRRHFEEGWGKGNLDVFDETIAADCILLPEGKPFGPEVFKRMVAKELADDSDARDTIKDIIAEGDKAVIYRVAQVTHRATGKTVEVEAIDILRFAEGKIVEMRLFVDRLSFLQQIGLVPPPEELDKKLRQMESEQS